MPQGDERMEEERNEFRRPRESRQGGDPNDTKRVIAGVLAGLIVVSAVLLGLYLWIGRGGQANKATKAQPASQSSETVPSSEAPSSEAVSSEAPSESASAEPSAEPSTEAPTEKVTEAPTEASTAPSTAPTEPPATRHEEVIINPVLTGETVEEQGVVFDLCEPQQVTAKGHVNLRTYPGVRDDADIAGTLYHGEWATRVGIGRNGWARLEWNGQIVYCVGNYITTDPDYSIEE